MIGVMTGKEMVKLLQDSGFVLARINGSHHLMACGEVTVAVPVHGKKELGKGLEHSILKQAGLK